MTDNLNATALPAPVPESSADLSSTAPLTRQGPHPVPYRGRFAPSPTGPLHMGSLIAAMASCLDARHHQGEWLLRMEDLDRPRCTPAAADAILRTLAGFGFEHDGAIVWQSRRDERYAEALAQLRQQGAAYPCACSRRELADSQLAPDGASIYPGTCRNGLPPGRLGRAWRIRVEPVTMHFCDRIQGESSTELARDVGDFVVRRADDLFAYQLAVVVDDADAGITDIVRGADLFASTPRQIWLQRRLGLPTPHYAHVPVATNRAGEKLSKQTLAQPLDNAHPVPAMVAALRFLGQQPPPDLLRATVPELWRWAFEHWQLARVPRVPSIIWETSHEN